MIYYYLFTLYVIVSLLVLFDLSNKLELITNQNLIDYIFSQPGMECNTPSKVLLMMFVVLLFPLVIFIASDENLLNKLEEYNNKNKDKIEKGD